MSTYLLAFAVCAYRKIESDVDNVKQKVRILVPDGDTSGYEFVLESTVKLFSIFKNFYAIPYPLPKLDLIIVPYLASTGMENWGFITHRMRELRYTDAFFNIKRKIEVSLIIAKDLSEQWFGNLVTMEWWNDFWLKEGFAIYMQYVGVNLSEPNWKMMDQFIVTVNQKILRRDSSIYALALNNEDYNIQVNYDLNIIYYRKAASIIRMLQNVLSMKTFQTGVQRFVNRYKYATANSRDFWNTLSEVSHNLNISKIMNTWVSQEGYPIIYANRSKVSVILRQERFEHAISDWSLPGSTFLIENRASDDMWFIPITYITNFNTQQKTYWLNMTNGELSLAKGTEWVKLNVRGTGFYRVMYNEELWGILINKIQANHSMFSAADRSNLLDDAFILGKWNTLNIKFALRLSTYLNKEQESLVWETAKYHFLYIHLLLNTSHINKFEKFVQGLLTPIVNSLNGFDGKGNDLEKKARLIILNLAITFNLKIVTDRAQQLFATAKADYKSPIEPNIRQAIYNAGVKYGKQDDWEFCWQHYTESSDAIEKQVLLEALAQTPDKDQLNTYLWYSLDTIGIDDVQYVFHNLAKNAFSSQIALTFLHGHLFQFGRRFTAEIIVYKFLRPLLINNCNEAEYMNAFPYMMIVNREHKRLLTYVLDKINGNIFFKNHIEGYVHQWLEDNGY